MSKLIAILYASLILFQSLNISFEDVSKFRVLLDHASYHKEAYGDSFFDFLSEHYGEAAVGHENDHSEHDDLPFKHDGKTCCHLNSSFTLQSFEFTKAPTSFVEIPFNFFYEESSSSFVKPGVFQPPRLA